MKKEKYREKKAHTSGHILNPEHKEFSMCVSVSQAIFFLLSLLFSNGAKFQCENDMEFWKRAISLVAFALYCLYFEYVCVSWMLKANNTKIKANNSSNNNEIGEKNKMDKRHIYRRESEQITQVVRFLSHDRSNMITVCARSHTQSLACVAGFFSCLLSNSSLFLSSFTFLFNFDWNIHILSYNTLRSSQFKRVVVCLALFQPENRLESFGCVAVSLFLLFFLFLLLLRFILFLFWMLSRARTHTTKTNRADMSGSEWEKETEE